MIDVKLTRAEALLIIELVKKSNQELINALLIAVEEQNDKEQVAKAARSNYLVNLASENKALRAMVDAKNMASKTNNVPAKVPVRRAKKGKYNLNTARGFTQNSIKGMKNGEIRVLKMPDSFTFDKFRSSVSSTLSQKFRGQHETKANIKDQTITIRKIKGTK